VREAAGLLAQQLPAARFEYITKLCDGEVCFLEWSGRSDTAQVRDGADSFLIRDGLIRAMTIHYTVHSLAP
jgi:hypothetical protein